MRWWGDEVVKTKKSAIEAEYLINRRHYDWSLVGEIISEFERQILYFQVSGWNCDVRLLNAPEFKSIYTKFIFANFSTKLLKCKIGNEQNEYPSRSLCYALNEMSLEQLIIMHQNCKFDSNWLNFCFVCLELWTTDDCIEGPRPSRSWEVASVCCCRFSYNLETHHEKTIIKHYLQLHNYEDFKSKMAIFNMYFHVSLSWNPQSN